MQAVPYIHFDGTCRKAMEFYRSVFGGETAYLSYKDINPEIPEGDQERLMHAELRSGEILLMASDSPPGMSLNPGDSMQVCMTSPDGNKLGKYFQALSEGGQIRAPYMKQAWGSELGMLSDKFGTLWIFSVRAEV